MNRSRTLLTLLGTMLLLSLAAPTTGAAPNVREVQGHILDDGTIMMLLYEDLDGSTYGVTNAENLRTKTIWSKVYSPSNRTEVELTFIWERNYGNESDPSWRRVHMVDEELRASDEGLVLTQVTLPEQKNTRLTISHDNETLLQVPYDTSPIFDKGEPKTVMEQYLNEFQRAMLYLGTFIAALGTAMIAHRRAKGVSPPMDLRWWMGNATLATLAGGYVWMNHKELVVLRGLLPLLGIVYIIMTLGILQGLRDEGVTWLFLRLRGEEESQSLRAKPREVRVLSQQVDDHADGANRYTVADPSWKGFFIRLAWGADAEVEIDETRTWYYENDHDTPFKRLYFCEEDPPKVTYPGLTSFRFWEFIPGIRLERACTRMPVAPRSYKNKVDMVQGDKSLDEIADRMNEMSRELAETKAKAEYRVVNRVRDEVDSILLGMDAAVTGDEPDVWKPDRSTGGTPA